MIGGNSRNAGKTTLACGIISKLAATHDTIGLKVTSIRPGEEGLHGAHDEDYLSDFEVIEELDAGTHKDTSKMLRAGAGHVFYLRVSDSYAEKAIVFFLKNFVNNQLIVCESRSLRNIVAPGLFVMMVRNPAVGEPKDVATYLDKADFIFNFAAQHQEIEEFYYNLHFKEDQFSFLKKTILG